ncbi:MAG: hypothetical protein KME49_21190 [Brasilonema octagenarum HA4186-MV1]|uniref:DNA polymerase Y-family little finger domain-containing protein n=2 Tax=Brasilonema TaxID=383614 RepID=A0A856MEM5_9CYAN|nr:MULTISPECIES: hypothetical protein [Brasilonema]MBW4627953.1 hypothetical protein [Brasilonema octagenarum HA4186-MV1]NMF62853.1 hypothetical protein [Brasilonema octagenarum UFV-OR1]QDL08740.1 hypothetical protein DP114_13310 [Brasilonema sennae CENA114]QDL15098.1 hypothetical protein DP113_13255 [Brasilonema octagenarum UFV-E1]
MSAIRLASSFWLIAYVARELFEAIELSDRSIRLLGISLSNLDNVQTSQAIQLALFELS